MIRLEDIRSGVLSRRTRHEICTKKQDMTKNRKVVYLVSVQAVLVIGKGRCFRKSFIQENIRPWRHTNRGERPCMSYRRFWWLEREEVSEKLYTPGQGSGRDAVEI